MVIPDLVDQIRRSARCGMHPPSGIPNVRDELTLPDDLLSFYSLCGGASLFIDADYGFDISSPAEFVPANPIIRPGIEMPPARPHDRSDDWYLLARSGLQWFVTIDLHPERLGRCYDSFWDRHGIVGSCATIAESFSSWLERTLASRGRTAYWIDSGFVSLGDAYDD